ncbi:D-alanyl-D-alanine carboxypeptidase [Planococcus sp. ISL-109]|nr:D-alanyl-D-alanine carboxypeptidase family protein [Planococcus sp. ISL-109]MBT2583979.1 D-alanyl-D-alanine carboxypeptidase [Planococcus sp. ISL-109]
MKWIQLLTIVVIVAALLVPQQVQAEETMPVLADAAIVVDADTSQILYGQNDEEVLGIASMSKMMSEYLMFEAIEKGQISWDDEYEVTDYTYRISQDLRLSNVPLRPNGSYTIKELYEAMAIYSANAATIGIAEMIAGTETDFVQMMNDKAKEMGIMDAQFVNSTGLNNTFLLGMHPEGTAEDDESTMSARSVAILSKALIDDYPEILETAKIPELMFREGTSDQIRMVNWNTMLPGMDYEYAGVDGLKTGTTDLAGHAFAGTAERDGRRLIAVVLKAVDAEGNGSYKARFDATRSLLDYGFDEFEEVEIMKADQQFMGQETLPVSKGEQEQVAIAIKEPIQLMVKATEQGAYRTELELSEQAPIEAAVEEGQLLGKVRILDPEGKEVMYLNGVEPAADVVAAEAVARANWFTLSMKGAVDFIKSLF